MFLNNMANEFTENMPAKKQQLTAEVQSTKW